MTGERRGFLRYAFHQIAIAADRIRIVVDNLVSRPVITRCKPSLRDSHSDTVAKTLSQRPGGHFDPYSMSSLWMPRSFAAPLPKPLQLIQRQIITGQIEQAVKQHGAVSRGEHEPVAIEPV